MNKNLTKSNIVRKQVSNKYQQVFIGKKIEITKTNNKEQQKIKGTIIYETKNTLSIRVQGAEHRTLVVMKNNKEFKINNEKIEGNKITKRPEERIKIKG